jgi:SSS family solute:Na+ symporter
MGFSFWATDFVQMQRARAVRHAEDGPLLPLRVAAAKLVFSFLIVIPGVVAPLVLGTEALGGKWNTTLPKLLVALDGPGWLVVGFLGIGASLLATFSNNVAGFSSAWVQGIYQEWIRPEAGDAELRRVSRMTVAGAVVLSTATATVALHFASLMEYVQLVLSTMNAPLFALVAVAVARPGFARRGGGRGFGAGLGASVGHQLLVLAGLLHYGSQMAANFYGAMLGFGVALGMTLLSGRQSTEVLPVMAVAMPGEPMRLRGGVLMLAMGIVVVTVALNVYFR